MKIARLARTSLGGKVFLTYLIVIAVGGIVIITAAEQLMPIAFDRHLAAMARQMGESSLLAEDLFAGYRRALVESLLLAAAVATAVAIGVSYYVSRRVVRPIESMLRVTQRIAKGEYAQRVALDGIGADAEHLDELQRLGVSLNQMAARLERTEHMRRELIGNVAHELRTPLTTIKGTIEGLADGVLTPSAETFDKVEREVARLQRLVSDLQELSRLEEGAFNLDRRPLDLGPLLEQAANRLRPQYEAKGVRLVTDVPATLPPVSGDGDRLSQVVVNLLGNALQYTPAGRSVTLRASLVGGAVRVQVIDQGIGIGAEHLPHLFERFYRVDRARARGGGGSGLGLTICKHLVEAHGGEISAASEGPGKGSTFSFSIPVIR
jgi:histidine kinase